MFCWNLQKKNHKLGCGSLVGRLREPSVGRDGTPKSAASASHQWAATGHKKRSWAARGACATRELPPARATPNIGDAHQPLSRPGFGSSWASLNEVGLGIHSCVAYIARLISVMGYMEMGMPTLLGPRHSPLRLPQQALVF